MKQTKQNIKVPENRELIIKLSDDYNSDDLVEVIIIQKNKNEYNNKLNQITNAMKDPLFLKDVKDISEDFNHLDLNSWD